MKKPSIKNYLVEIKIGVFFLFAFILLFITLLSIREVTFLRGTYILKAKFRFSEGLRPASPVRFSGVDVGEVKKVQIREENGNPCVFVFAKIQKGVRIPQGSYFFINSLSLFGEKYLEITPPREVKGYLKENDVVEGISPVPLFNVFATFNKTMEEINEFVREGKIKTSFENILTNMEEVSISMKNIVAGIEDQDGTIGKLLYDDSLYKITEEFISDLKENPWKLLHKPKKVR